jgi:hypothetical protein
MMPRAGDVEVDVPGTHGDGSGKSTPKGVGDTSMVEELTFELKVLKLQEKIVKLKKKLKFKCLLHPQMKKEMNPSPPMKAIKPRKAMGKRRKGLSLPITQPLSIMIACPLTMPSHPCMSASCPVSMRRTMPNDITL